MKIYERHRWNLDYGEAVAVQHELAKTVKLKTLALSRIRYVAGADIAIDKRRNLLFGAVVVLRFPSLELVETRTAVVETTFPYIPGLLSFREIPCLVECLRRVTTSVDVVVCDGQGIAHPRGVGLASHLGILLRRPVIGCAKSLLVGDHAPLGPSRGDYAPLLFHGRRVGSVLRTQDGIRPVFVSPGHLSDVAGSRRLVLACSTRYRLPEPTRYADRVAGETKRRLN